MLFNYIKQIFYMYNQHIFSLFYAYNFWLIKHITFLEILSSENNIKFLNF